MNVLRAGDGNRPAYLAGVFGWSLVALAAWDISRVFNVDYRPGVLVAATAIGGLACYAVSALVWQIRAAAYLVVTIGLSAGVTVIVAPPVDVLAAMARAPLHGFGDLAAAVWPSPALPAGVAAFALLTVSAACLATDFSLRRHGGAAIFLPIVVLAVVALLSAEAGPPSLAMLLSYLVLALGLLRVQQPHRQSNVSLGFSVAMVVLIGAVPVVGNELLTADRFDPRASLDGRSPADSGVSPLSRVNLWRNEEPATVLFTSTLPRAARWRLVGLTSFDGREWLPADNYRVSGNIVRVANPALDTTTLEVSLGSLRSPWLPSPDRAVRVSRPVEVDEEYSGLLVGTADEPASGATYELQTQPRTATPAEIAAGAAAPGESPFVGSFQLPTSIQRLAQSIVADAASDAERAERIASYLRESFVLDPTAAPGHSFAVINLFLETTRRGSDEQFVSAFALLAAAVGLPVRISVGFDTVPDPSGAAGTVAPSTKAVAWPEVEFVDLGWVSFDPVPSEANQQPSNPQGGTSGPAEVLDSPTPPVSAPAVVEAAVNDPAPAPPAIEPAQESTRNNGLIITLLVLAATALLAGMAYVIAVLAVKQRRMQRRTQLADPRARVLAAFRSGIDVVVDLGGEASTARTDRELVLASSAVVVDAARSLAPVARTATAAVFAPELVIDDGHADEAWQRVQEFQRTASRRVGTRRALRARLSLRSLRRGLPDG